MKKVLSIILCIVLVLSIFAGCSGSSASIDFIYPFSADVNSYDPQVASTADEYLIVENTFEGLIRMDDNGKIKAGVADSWSVSSDGLTYTFKLKKGMKWNLDASKDEDGKFEDERLQMLGHKFDPDITANDFVFALRRAAQPETNCPLFSSISAIVNATKVHSGKLDSSELGVTAVDDYTLQIKLENADESFMQTLTTAVAMPCNETFFNATKGRYGLEYKYTLFNGQFYVDQILEASYLLKKNELYTGDYPAKASELTLKINTDESDEDLVNNIEDGYYDAAFIDGSIAENIKKSSGVTYTPYNNTTWAFIFNTNTELFANKNVRKAFCLGFTRLTDTGKEYIKDASNLTPSSCMIGANDACKAIGSTVTAQDTKTALELWNKALKEYADTEFTVTILTTKDMESYVKKMIQGLQSGICNSGINGDGENVSLTIKVNSVSEDDYKTALNTKDYDIALKSFKANSTSAISYLKTFSDDNPTGFDTTKLDKDIENAENAADLTSIAKYAKQAEQDIIGTYTVYPMLYEYSYYTSAKGVSGVQFHPGTGRVSFVYATRK